MSLLTDLRFAFRLFLKNPGSSAMAIFVVAVGTSVAITMFAFVNGILWSPLDLNEEREILKLEWAFPDKQRNQTTIHPLDFEVIKKESQSFEKLTSFQWSNLNFYNPAGNSFSRRYELAFVDPDFFDFIKETPLLGRTFRPEDAIGRNEDTLIISHSIWREHFESDENIAGTTAMLDGKRCTIVGVMPEGFRFPDEVHIWVATDWAQARELERKSWHRTQAIGVLKNGYSKEKAKSDLATIALKLSKTYPNTNEDLHEIRLEPYSIWLTKTIVSQRFDKTCYALLLCAILVLGVACSNLFNLIMTRTATRTNELSIRNAMGANRSHIISQVVFDGLILTLVGSALGTLISYWGLKLVWALFKKQMYVPYWWRLEMDGRVIGFVVVIVIATAAAATLLPGLRASRSSVAKNLREDTRTSTGLYLGAISKFVLNFQILTTGGLVFMSVAMMLFWIHSKKWETPYDPDQILDGALQLKAMDQEREKGLIPQFIETFEDRLSAYPKAAKFAFSSEEAGGADPESTWMNLDRFEFDGESYELAETRPEARRVVISEGYQDVFNLKILHGRGLSKRDTRENDQVCLVNENFVSHYWKNQNPIGKRIKFYDPNAPDQQPFRTVVGVIANVSPDPMPGQNFIESGFAKIYVPVAQASYINDLHILVLSEGDPFDWTVPLQTELRSMNPELAFHGRFLTVKGIVDRNSVSKDLTFSMFAVFGFSSLILGIGGLYAVVSFTTRQRFREFAIRMAIGASGSEILLNVMKRGSLARFLAAAVGIAIGHYVVLILKTSIGIYYLPLLYAYPIAVLVVLSAIGLSMGFPAWQASKLTPLQAMRTN
ncbi:efflux ABC transporter, permease protein [Verrucomicrobiia bacterium DG1235]|nr:efflux ABC transporter, permease protein [Verrucomicrobiae bacterium DG1235]